MNNNDKPTRIDSDGCKFWEVDGKLHRENGPAIEAKSGTKVWYINGLQHRDDGPAMETHCGKKVWFKHGKAHREDGPAVEDEVNGLNLKEWWIDGVKYSEQEFNFIILQKELTFNEKGTKKLKI
jgi:hypothetical protein